MNKHIITFIFFTIITIIVCACEEDDDIKIITREEAIPESAIKITPETDNFPPILHSKEWQEPVPLIGIVNTAGVEDSPFIPIGKNEIYFFFTPNVSIPAEDQLTDGASGIYQAELLDTESLNVQRLVLQDNDKLALDGCPFVLADTIWFCSFREGYTGSHWFKAEYQDMEWVNWHNSDFNRAYAVGELHIHNDMLYYHSNRNGSIENYDIWQSQLIDNEWSAPVNITSINTSAMEGYPFIAANGNELWFTRNYLGSPAIFRSIKINENWTEPELIISQFAGEPTLDTDGNIYFAHHFYHDGEMLEADIYIAKKK